MPPHDRRFAIRRAGRVGADDPADTPRDQEVPRQGAGSGFIVDSNGYILTNYHVMEGAERITVTLADGRVFRGTVAGSDPAIDVALVTYPERHEFAGGAAG